VLWFDEFYDEAHYRARTADSLVARASLCITIGTSGGVPFAVRMASIAAKAGALLVDINLRRLAVESAGVVIRSGHCRRPGRDERH
jgi:NAD-dependent SIR2 family protein deacetylase